MNDLAIIGGRQDETSPLIFVRPLARADLKEAFLFIAENNTENAIRFLKSARATMENLATMPLMGSPRYFRNAQLLDIRQWPVKGFSKYLIFYRSLDSQQGIEVIRVLNAKRDLEAVLNEQDLA